LPNTYKNNQDDNLRKNQIKNALIPSNEVINEKRNESVNERNKNDNHNNLKLNKHDDTNSVRQQNDKYKTDTKSKPKSFRLYYITSKIVTHSSEVSKATNNDERSVKVDLKSNKETPVQKIPSNSNGPALDRTKNDSMINANENRGPKKITEKGI
jgi:hypothetical protein